MLFRSKHHPCQLRSLCVHSKFPLCLICKEMLRAQTWACSVLVRPSPPADPDLCSGTETVERLLSRLLNPHSALSENNYLKWQAKYPNTHDLWCKAAVIDDTSDDLWSGATYRCDSAKDGLIFYFFLVVAINVRLFRSAGALSMCMGVFWFVFVLMCLSLAAVLNTWSGLTGNAGVLRSCVFGRGSAQDSNAERD